MKLEFAELSEITSDDSSFCAIKFRYSGLGIPSLDMHVNHFPQCLSLIFGFCGLFEVFGTLGAFGTFGALTRWVLKFFLKGFDQGG